MKASLKSKIDKLWLEFYSGGITNPLTVIEQITYLMWARMLDIREMRNEKRAQRLGELHYDTLFPTGLEHLRWSKLKHESADEQLRIVQGNRSSDDPDTWKGLFQFFREDVARKSRLGSYLRDAQCAINKASLLKQAIEMIDELPLTAGDTKGDLYEYLLSKLTTAGVAGQFRTPRHVIAAMVEMLDVQPDQTVCDPACGTGGFLLEVMDYLRRTHTSPELVTEAIDDETGKVEKDDHGHPIKLYPGDRLAGYREHINKHMFHGYDFDSTMLRIAAMNMLLHGIEEPSIEYRDSLSEQAGLARDCEGAFDIVLANPPFKGSIDHESVYKGLTSVAKTKKTELLFLVLIEKLLNTGGKAAVIVPDGVLFGSSSAHKAVRRLLVEENGLDAVVSLPSGVFKPYAGVSTAILFFTKADTTDHVWFYKVEHDGYSLDDKRTPVKDDDLPKLLEAWKQRDPEKDTDRTAKGFFVPKKEIAANKYDLSLNRYAEVNYEEVEYAPPKEILQELRDLETDILKDLDKLEAMLG